VSERVTGTFFCWRWLIWVQTFWDQALPAHTRMDQGVVCCGTKQPRRHCTRKVLGVVAESERNHCPYQPVQGAEKLAVCQELWKRSVSKRWRKWVSNEFGATYERQACGASLATNRRFKSGATTLITP
jgi:hypothetical protein